MYIGVSDTGWNTLLVNLILPIIFISSGKHFFINLWTNLVENAVVGQSKVLNLSASDKFRKLGVSWLNLVNMQVRSELNTGHRIKKWNSSSIAGTAVGADGGCDGAVASWVWRGWDTGQQYLQYLWSAGVIGRVCLPNSMLSLWFDGRRHLTEDDLWRKTNFDGRGPLTEDDLLQKMTFDGRRPLTEDDLLPKTTLKGRGSLMEDNF